MRRRRQSSVLGVGALVVALGVIVVVVIGTGVYRVGGPSTTTVGADFRDASNVRSGQPVRIRGVDVGTVSRVAALDGGRTARVWMKVDASDAKVLRRDARARIWWRTLLGRNMYVELEPGVSRAPLRGATIPVTSTSHQVELDQVFTAFPAHGRRGIRESIKGLALGVGNGPAVRSSARALDPALRSTAVATRALRGTRTGDLGTLVRGTSRMLGSFDRDERALGGAIDSAQTTFAVTAARRSDIAATLAVAPSALSVTRRQLRRLDGTLALLDPVVARLRPQARRVAPTVDRLRLALARTTPFLRDARPLVRELRPALSDLMTASRQGDPLVTGLTPVVDRLRTDILPFLDRTTPLQGEKLYKLIGPLASELDSAGSTFDAQAHFIAFQGGFSSRSGEGILPCTALLTDPTAAQKLTCENLNVIFKQLTGKPVPAIPGVTPAKGAGG